MQSITWEQESDPKKVKITFFSLGQSYYISQTEIINQLASSANKQVRVHKDAQVFETDFLGIKDVIQKPGGPRNKGNNTISTTTGEVCAIEQKGQWLGPDGWQEKRQFIKLRPINSIAPPPPPEYKVCKNILKEDLFLDGQVIKAGQVCDTLNFIGAPVCRVCKSEPTIKFEPVAI
ncbi:hypothetical protein [Spirosoma linguale]|uniref:Uncharacterized protein n=1 Tax=Spirosoma linguale (strain ATCC 33905 / DSM 74 / LMG 10896 / Claus 1) TaxID=504472 RepID=D2QUF8_SPILD|nr:hypothetical protein Slin_6483 [Spirosoma linguale DSM 74]